ncbi:MAG: exosortase/archaeosortase family protein, partial [Planctomycetaceae bacterium]|nr:exosortase/archaeosortase family protein [Planctomycetaceae bacterium]
MRLGVPAFGPWALLLMMLRIPYGHDLAAIQAMQRFTTELSAIALDSTGIEHFAQGNILEFPSRSLFVEEACSGVVSMMAMIACAAILAVWWRRSLLHGILLMASGIFWAGAMNVIRVVLIAVALAQYQIDLTEGWPHAALGLFAFAVSLGALASTDRLLLFGTSRIPKNPLASYWPYADENHLVSVWNAVAGSETDAEVHYGENSDDWDAAPNEEPVQEREPVTTVASPPPRAWEWIFVP